MGISFWLVPSDASSTPLKTAIQKIGEKHEGPAFEPHVTLFSLPGGISANEQLFEAIRPVCTATNAVALVQNEVQVGETYHQSVFLSLKSTDALVDLRKRLLEAVGAPATTESPHFPHASLYYGDGSSEDKHHLVMQMMDARILDISSEGKIEVSEVAQNEFHFDSIQIVDIVTREPKDWKVLHTERLRGTNPAAPALQVTPPAPSESASPTASGSPKSNGASTTTAVAPDSTTETKQNGNHEEKSANPAPTPAAAAPAVAPATSGAALEQRKKVSFLTKLKRFILCQ